MLQMADALSGGRVLYLSVPLTSGRRELRLLRSGHDAGWTDLERAERRALVLEANKREAWVYAHLARARFPGTVVVDPSRLDHPSWGQDEYNSFWADLITERVSAVVAAPGWAFSRGARLELDLAVRLGLPIVTIEGAPLDAGDIAAADRAAHEELSSAPELDGYLSPMASLRGVQPTASSRPSPVARVMGEVIGWLRGERAYQLEKFGIDADDRHTAEGLGEGDWWWRQLTTYLHRGAIALGVETPGGRQALAKYAATACGLAESVMRSVGPLLPDAPGPGGRPERLRPGGEPEALFRWLIRQRAEVLDGQEASRHDAWLSAGLGPGSPWWNASMDSLRDGQQFPLGSIDGRRAVGEILVRSCAFNEAVCRRYGQLPAPGVASGYGLLSSQPA